MVDSSIGTCLGNNIGTVLCNVQSSNLLASAHAVYFSDLEAEREISLSAQRSSEENVVVAVAQGRRRVG